MAGISEAEFKLRISDAKVNAFLILEPLVDLNKNLHESEIKVRAAAAILAVDADQLLECGKIAGDVYPD